MLVEDWSYGDSFYFYMIIFMMVGFGDLVLFVRYISVFFIMFGLVVVLNILYGVVLFLLIRCIIMGLLRDEEMVEVEE